MHFKGLSTLHQVTPDQLKQLYAPLDLDEEDMFPDAIYRRVEDPGDSKAGESCRRAVMKGNLATLWDVWGRMLVLEREAENQLEMLASWGRALKNFETDGMFASVTECTSTWHEMAAETLIDLEPEIEWTDEKRADLGRDPVPDWIDGEGYQWK